MKKRQRTGSEMGGAMDGPITQRFRAGQFSNLQKVINGNVDCGVSDVGEFELRIHKDPI